MNAFTTRLSSAALSLVGTVALVTFSTSTSAVGAPRGPVVAPNQIAALTSVPSNG